MVLIFASFISQAAVPIPKPNRVAAFGRDTIFPPASIAH
jgi:hypothetical protein